MTNILQEGVATQEQIARYLGVSKRQVYYLQEEGKIPYCYVGSRRRSPIVSIKQYLLETINVKGNSNENESK